jgi:hypothetical protein
METLKIEYQDKSLAWEIHSFYCLALSSAVFNWYFSLSEADRAAVEELPVFVNHNSPIRFISTKGLVRYAVV